jgi:Zn ribbon nucleic-acid-binding protein
MGAVSDTIICPKCIEESTIELENDDLEVKFCPICGFELSEAEDDIFFDEEE